MNPVKIWTLASRPKTLLAALVPVTVGAAIAASEGKIDYISTFIALVCAVLIQIGTNFVNDLYDHLKGADTKKRVGPVRVLNAGLVSVKQMRIAIAIVFSISFFIGLILVDKGGVPVLMIGVASLLAGYAYTAGPFPLAYKGLGDIFVFIFFGFVATVGTYYINTLSVTMIPILASIPVGALITNILVVNNYRDIDQDKIAGKITLAVRIGKKNTRYEYIFLILTSFITPVLIYFVGKQGLWILLPYLTLPLGLRLIRMLNQYTGPQLNSTLELTAKFSALYGLLFALGFIL
ncbi:MAG: 1,4-dihydroxy-2-naphthoate polyprenyltransferase [Ignavibacteriaceae bacterium]|nr:1,4-dihydroxy-2-naphthoate polyprenyltransferase [Ignavibacteriaceae bacterium]